MTIRAASSLWGVSDTTTPSAAVANTKFETTMNRRFAPNEATPSTEQKRSGITTEEMSASETASAPGLTERL